MSRSPAVLFTLSAAFASLWAGWLVRVHRDAVRHTLEPGVLCGPDGGCGDVLASSWAALAGVPVSAPAVPLFAALAVLGALTAAGRLAPARVAALGTACGLAGIGFGAFLLWKMLGEIGAVCRYCLVMDAATLGTLFSALALHPGGPLAALREAPSSVARALRPGPELATGLTVALVTTLFPIVLPEPAEQHVDVVAVGAGLGAGVAQPTGETRRVVIPAERVDVPIPDGARARGRADAPVTIALFEDFQCPYCAKLTGNLEAFLHERDDVRLVWFDFPMHRACNVRELKKDLHADACRAAAAGVCADREGRFWALHDRMFQNNAKLGDKDLLVYAAEVGLDLPSFRRCLGDPATLEAVRRDTELGVALGVTGTPTFFVNGRKFSGAQPVEALRAIVGALAEEPSDRVLLDVPLDGEVTGAITGAPSTVTLDGPRGRFTIDAFEASLEGGVAVSRPGVEPARGLGWYEADAACRAAGKRLCTEDEWLTACAGALPVDEDGDGVLSDERLRGRAHPYGAWLQESWCASARERDDARPLLTGDHPRCVTPEGVFDLEGGVKEWIGLTPDAAGLKGGSYFSKTSARCAYLKDGVAPDAVDASNGFRCCSGAEPQRVDHHPGGKVGDLVADWSLPLMDGGGIGRDALAGKPHVLTFWASWCGPCREEMPALEALSREYADRGVVVVGIDVDQDPARGRAFLAKTPVSFPIALDPDSAVMARFATRGTPTTFWVTKSGRIRQRTVGYEAAGLDEMREQFEALLTAE